MAWDCGYSMAVLSGWGRLSRENCQVLNLTSSVVARTSIKNVENAIFYGNGRSYGDIALNPSGVVYKTSNMDRFISFDPAKGLLHCEAGVSLRDIHSLVIPRGWMLPVTPGTQLITVGGAIANDIHGKNHHLCGTFGHHLVEITLARTSGELIVCGPKSNSDWFSATVGGAGLTGLILS